MKQVGEALSIIKENCCKMPIVKIRVSKSLNFILAESIYSPMNMPPFRQSSMDGYAFFHSKLNQFEVISTSQAGDFSNIELKKNEAIRIFTGAFIPDCLDTVVMQEHTAIKEGLLEILKKPPRFTNIRNTGDQIQKGKLVIEKDTIISPAAIGFLVCLGITEIKVYGKPKVAIIVTGNELVKAGKKLPMGKIYESNSVMLEVALKELSIKKIKTFKVKDTLNVTIEVLKKCLSNFDLVLVSGGISVGDYDFVKEALELNGVTQLFYTINQKPGKPIYFGKKDQTFVFALPGNPASTLTSFYIYALPALKKMMGFQSIHLTEIKRKINVDFENTTGKALFLKAFYDDKNVTILDSQSSAMLNTFAMANGFVYFAYDAVNIKKNQDVIVIPIN